MNKLISYDVIIIGAGISGSTLARLYAEQGKKVCVIEKREHIAGNCYDYINEARILISKYGAHIFHTNSDEVWEFVNRFASWKNYEHKVVSYVDGKCVPIPVNITTINTLFDLNLKTEKEVKNWFENNTQKYDNIANSEEAGLSRVGVELYNKMFKNYTQKQWSKDPSELDKSILKRIPIRYDDNDRYFSDKFEAMPVGGYTKFFEAMLSHENITVMLNQEANKKHFNKNQKIFYTGKIDQYFEHVEGKLEYRSLNFEHTTYSVDSLTEYSVINYPDINVDYTRSIEWKNLNKQEVKGKTTITYEFPTDIGEPYYPVVNEENIKLFEKYKKLSVELEKENVYFVGRLANFKYFNMDQAFLNAIELFKKIENIKTL